MKGVQRFEDLIAWQKARALTKRVYTMTKVGDFARDFRLAGQIQDASVSIMSNIAEGFERKTPAQFLYFLNVSKSSCAEVRSKLYVALDVGYIEEPTFHALYSEANETGRVIGGLMGSV